MKKLIVLGAVAALAFSAPAFAAPKTYQVTGPVVELSADKIVVQKGKEKWEIAQGSAALPAGVKVGDKVTIEYSMTAATVTSKEASAKPASPAAGKQAKGSKSGKSEPASAAMAPNAPSAAPSSTPAPPASAPASK